MRADEKPDYLLNTRGEYMGLGLTPLDRYNNLHPDEIHSAWLEKEGLLVQEDGRAEKIQKKRKRGRPKGLRPSLAMSGYWRKRISLNARNRSYSGRMMIRWQSRANINIASGSGFSIPSPAGVGLMTTSSIWMNRWCCGVHIPSLPPLYLSRS